MGAEGGLGAQQAQAQLSACIQTPNYIFRAPTAQTQIAAEARGKAGEGQRGKEGEGETKKKKIIIIKQISRERK